MLGAPLRPLVALGLLDRPATGSLTFAAVAVAAGWAYHVWCEHATSTRGRRRNRRPPAGRRRAAGAESPAVVAVLTNGFRVPTSGGDRHRDRSRGPGLDPGRRRRRRVGRAHARSGHCRRLPAVARAAGPQPSRFASVQRRRVDRHVGGRPVPHRSSLVAAIRAIGGGAHPSTAAERASVLDGATRTRRRRRGGRPDRVDPRHDPRHRRRPRPVVADLASSRSSCSPRSRRSSWVTVPARHRVGSASHRAKVAARAAAWLGLPAPTPGPDPRRCVGGRHSAATVGTRARRA